MLDRLDSLIEIPRQTRMPGLLVHGASGIGKTMIARNLSRRHAQEYDLESGIMRTPLFFRRHRQPLTSGDSTFTSLQPSARRQQH